MAHEELAGRPNSPIGRILKVELDREIDRLKSSKEWQQGDRVSASLVKDLGLNVVLILLRKGSRLGEHHTKGPVAVTVIDGTIRFATPGDAATVRKGELVAIDKEVTHSVEAAEDSTLMLTTSL